MEVTLAAYTKATMRAVDKYVKANYDRIEVKVPKGQKQAIELFAREQGESVNAMVNRLIRTEMGVSENEWKEEGLMKSINSLRRTLGEHGYSLRKKHKGQDTGYLIVDDRIDMAVAGSMSGQYAPGLTLEEVQQWIDAQEW